MYVCVCVCVGEGAVCVCVCVYVCVLCVLVCVCACGCVYCADLFVPNVRVTAKQDSMVCNIMRPISACMQESNSESVA